MTSIPPYARLQLVADDPPCSPCRCDSERLAFVRETAVDAARQYVAGYLAFEAGIFNETPYTVADKLQTLRDSLATYRQAKERAR